MILRNPSEIQYRIVVDALKFGNTARCPACGSQAAEVNIGGQLGWADCVIVPVNAPAHHVPPSAPGRSETCTVLPAAALGTLTLPASTGQILKRSRKKSNFSRQSKSLLGTTRT